MIGLHKDGAGWLFRLVLVRIEVFQMSKSELLLQHMVEGSALLLVLMIAGAIACA